MGVPMPMLGPKDSDYYVSLDRNKKGIVIDLAQPEGADLARRRAAQADIVMENFRPQVMGRLGLGFDDLRKLRRGMVYCSISAFGSSGPWSKRPASDIIMQSVSGLMSITGEVGGGRYASARRFPISRAVSLAWRALLQRSLRATAFLRDNTSRSRCSTLRSP